MAINNLGLKLANDGYVRILKPLVFNGEQLVDLQGNLMYRELHMKASVSEDMIAKNIVLSANDGKKHSVKVIEQKLKNILTPDNRVAFTVHDIVQKHPDVKIECGKKGAEYVVRAR